MTIKAKTEGAWTEGRGAAGDGCQTPAYALLPILEFMDSIPSGAIWEPACGEGLLANELERNGYRVERGDILLGKDFFLEDPPAGCVAQITNPPYSKKYAWLDRSYKLGMPFALLMPVDVIGAGRAQRLFDRHGVGIILMDARVNFKMPRKGWAGTPHFASAWFTWGFSVPPLEFYSFPKGLIKRQMRMLRMGERDGE